MWPSPVDIRNPSDGPSEAEIPILPEADYGSGWDPTVTVNTFRDFPYDYATLGVSRQFFAERCIYHTVRMGCNIFLMWMPLC